MILLGKKEKKWDGGVNKTKRNAYFYFTGINSQFSKAIIIKIVYTHFFVIQTSSSGVNNYVMVDGYVYLWTDVWNNNASTIRNNIYISTNAIYHRILYQIYYIAKTKQSEREREMWEMGENHRVSCQTFTFICFGAFGFRICHCKCSYIDEHTVIATWYMIHDCKTVLPPPMNTKCYPKKWLFNVCRVHKKYICLRARFSF